MDAGGARRRTTKAGWAASAYNASDHAVIRHHAPWGSPVPPGRRGWRRLHFRWRDPVDRDL